uniref:Centromere-associated protein E n=1 Tax=Ictidomys tridecemlineatus TaxID=43179 RepID=I3MWZ2_ICTTR
MAEEGAVAVCVRVRPLSSREEELGEATQVYWKTDNNAIYQVDGSKSFNFDRVFHSSETTKNVYEEIAVPIIDSAIQGYNGTIFAYGQTASGKTHTMMGSEDCLGVIPRAIHDIFQKIKKFPEREFLLRVSYMEIYNEIITDLLCNTQKMKPLIIREDINRNVYVADLTEEVVYTSEMALQWITKGEKNRHYGITKMNQRSSRSHTIFRMILESREKGEPSNCEGSIKVSHLNLVDLAGSERAAQTGAEGVRLKEGCNINRSLFILGQVIKKLSDGQIGGFINYRDSKLTRILQNSLGGNAKTRIICTITPVSFDETLSTLQFASTAKYMKNTPYVNEVSSDEALLKRYRKEIVDLKKQLEEVSIKTRAQEMEKDQLAQLLDEKDLLQKVQDEKIQNLTRMLVTSSSLTMQQELKAKRKRRVTWCFGKINKMKDSNYVNEFNMPANVTTRRHKTDSAVLGEIDESLYLESDVFSNTLDSLTEIEWNSATKLLSQENLESELNSLRAKYDNLVLDCEQLRRENEEMGLKLKEKNDLDEFEALERKAEKDQEMQLIHEISNLKNLVKHAEVYNQDLENELNSKVKLLEEKEDQIKNLQKYIDTRKSENIKMDLSYSLENTEDLKQMQQTLFDAETVALDAKKQSAFLRSENLELKEKMKELESTCKQMENDIQLYQSQLEAKKKMQVDLDKELQSAFNEITTLNSLIDGKVPKDLLCNLELERRITELQKELNRESKENEALRKEVDLLSELKSLPHEMEMLRKEIHEKSEELSIITSEKDKLFSEVAHKESRIQGLLEEIEKTKDDLTTTQLNYKSTEQEFQDFKTLHIECEQKYKMVLKKNERMNQEIGNLSKEAENLGLSLDALKTELSHKTQELQQKTTEGQERLNEVEQLKEQLESRDSRLQAVEKETTLITEKLQKALEEVKTLTREKDDLKQLQESLQIERDQLKSDIQDTINLNIDSQEQLRSALESLKQHQETINTLKMKNSEETSGNSLLEENLGKTKDEFQQKFLFLQKELNRESKESEALRKEIHEKSEELSIITSEKDKLFSEVAHKESRIQGLLEEIEKTKDDLTTTQLNYKSTEQEFQDFKTLHIECEQKYKMVLKKNERMNQEIGNLSKEAENLGLSLDALKTELSHKTQELQQKTTEGQERLNEVEQLKEQLESRDSRLQAVEKETTLITEKLQKALEEVKTLTREKDDLKQLQESLQIERDQLKSDIQDTINLNIDSQEQLRSALESLKQHQETINTLKMKNSEETSGNSLLEENLGKTKDEFQQKVQGERRGNYMEMEGYPDCYTKLHIRGEGKGGGKSKSIRLYLQPTIVAEILSRVINSSEKNEALLEVGAIDDSDGENKGIKFKVASSFFRRKNTSSVKVMQYLWKIYRKERDLSFNFIIVVQIVLISEQVGDINKKQNLEAKTSQALIGDLKDSDVTEQQKMICSLIQEKNELQQMLESITAEKEQLKTDLKENIEMTIKNQEELRILEDELKKQQEIVAQEKNHVMKKDKELSKTCERLAEVEEKLNTITITKMFVVSQITPFLEEVKSTALEVNASEFVLGHSFLLKIENKDLEKQEELRIAHMDLKEHQETIDKLQRTVSEKNDEILNMQMNLENIQELREKEHQLLKVKNDLKENVYETEQLKKQLEAQNSALESLELEKLMLTQKINESLEKLKLFTEENDGLRIVEETLKVERDKLRENLRETEAKVSYTHSSCYKCIIIFTKKIYHFTKKKKKKEDLKKQEELRIAHMDLNEHQETINKLRGIVSEKTDEMANMKIDLENSNIQKLKGNEQKLFKLKEDVSEIQKQLKDQGLTLGNLAQNLQDNFEEMKSVMKERDNIRRSEEMLKLERDQLKENLQDTIAKDLETQQELKLIHMYLKEQQQTIEKFREKVSGKTTQIINIQKDLDKSKDELQKKIQELQEKELQLLKMNKDVNKSDKKMNEMEHLKRQIEAQNVSVKTVDMDNLCSTKKLHENLEEIRTVAKESNELRRKKECLKMERDQFREIIRKMIARDHQNHKEIIKYERSSLCDGEEHNTESLREKCFRIKELLQRYSEMDNHYEYLNKLSFDLEKEIETQKDLSIRVKANLLLPYPQTKQIQKLFAANQRCSMEFHRVIKKLKYVLSYITKMKEEQHESINKFEIAFIDEVEKQNELQIKIQHLQQDYDIPSKELRHSKLNQSLDLHIEEILKDFSENDFPSIKTELQVFSNRKKMTQVLEEWLSTPFNIEELKNSIQKENDSICQVNYFYHNKITGIINESTEFEERSVTRSKEWEHDLKSIIEKNKKLFEDYQTLTVSPISGAQANPIVQDNKNPHVTSRAVQPTERIQELENSLREAKESAVHKESKIIKMQKELEMTNNIIAKLQAKINESNKCLDKTKEKMQALQDQVALGAKPYKEEIEDLKTKLVKIDLEKMKTAKEFEKEIHSTKATIDYQKEVIRVLRENLRRSQQAQDASMISEHTDSQPSNKPITCGGGSGIIQSTKALILKSEYIRLEKEISKLKQQNEQLIKQKNDLLSNNQHLSNEVKTWKERTLKREVCKEVTCENSPKSPKVTETDSKKIQNIPSQYKEQNVQNPVPKESPKSWFFDNRSKSLPAPRPVRYFDNSSLGLCPEEQTIGAECVDPKPGPWYTSGKDAPECKTQ